MSKKDDVHMMCLRNLPEYKHVESTEGKCYKCGHGVWISTESLKLALKHNAKYVCGECMLERLDNLPENRKVHIALPTKEQVGEIVDQYISLEEDDRDN